MLENARILIVEDDVTFAELLLCHLRKLNCDVAVAATGAEALKMCELAGTPPDVVVMDIGLPGMDGVSCARQIRHRYPTTEIIFLTGLLEDSVLTRARDVKPAAFILKDEVAGGMGVRGESLSAAVRLTLDQRDNRRLLEASNVRHRRLNLTDDLTHLCNRRGFMAMAPRYLAPGNQAVMFIDLDNMKAINDAHGHEAGDEALRRFATVLRNVFREDDLVARLSGDEFAVLADVGTDGIAKAKQRVHHAMELANLGGGHPYRLEASIGAVPAPPGSDIADLLNRADAAMYEEKRNRKGRRRPS